MARSGRCAPPGYLVAGPTRAVNIRGAIITTTGYISCGWTLPCGGAGPSAPGIGTRTMAPSFPRSVWLQFVARRWFVAHLRVWADALVKPPALVRLQCTRAGTSSIDEFGCKARPGPVVVDANAIIQGVYNFYVLCRCTDARARAQATGWPRSWLAIALHIRGQRPTAVPGRRPPSSRAESALYTLGMLVDMRRRQSLQ